jgi:hypothetical protein
MSNIIEISKEITSIEYQTSVFFNKLIPLIPKGNPASISLSRFNYFIEKSAKDIDGYLRSTIFNVIPRTTASILIINSLNARNECIRLRSMYARLKSTPQYKDHPHVNEAIIAIDELIPKLERLHALGNEALIIFNEGAANRKSQEDAHKKYA